MVECHVCQRKTQELSDGTPYPVKCNVILLSTYVTKIEYIGDEEFIFSDYGNIIRGKYDIVIAIE
jgi:hypothetical protein